MAQLTEYSGFFPIMQTELAGCDTPVILAALRRAAREFCEDTEVWRPNANVAVVADQRQYDISMTDATVRRIVCVRIVDTTIDSVEDPNAGRVIDPIRYSLVRSAGSYLLDFHTPYIPGDEDAGRTVVVTRALIPDEVVDALPDDFLTEWSTAIRALALHTLYAAPQKPWSDPGQAVRYDERYQTQLLRALVERNKDNKYMDQQAVGLPFAM